MSRAIFPRRQFTYSQPVVDPTVHTIDSGQLENLPVGTQGPATVGSTSMAKVFRCARRAGWCWYYKANLGKPSSSAARGRTAAGIGARRGQAGTSSWTWAATGRST